MSDFRMDPVAAPLLLDEDGMPVRCLEDHGEQTCRGPVEYHTIGSSLQAWPRCRLHFEQRLQRYEESELERYADSDVAPDWFDPADAGERWDDDY